MSDHEHTLGEVISNDLLAPQLMRIYLTYQSVLFGVVLWDFLVCLRKEYKLIWKSQLSFTKVLYLLSRYVSLALTSAVFALNYIEKPLSQCNLLVRCNCAAITLIQAISLTVLAQRAYFISLKRKWVLASMLPFIVATLVMGIWHAASAVGAGMQSSAFGICWASIKDGWHVFTAVFFAVPLIGHAVATGIIFFHARKHLPYNAGLRRLLIIDGILYLLAVDTVSLVQLLFFLLSKRHMIAMMNAAALLSLTSVFCCRFMLHTRSQARKMPGSGADASSEPPDWTNHFGKPSKTSSREPCISRVSMLSQPTRHLSRLGDEGAATIEEIPELEIPEVEMKFFMQDPHRPMPVLMEHTVLQVMESDSDTLKSSS